jgi:hypothetical protein
MSCSHDGFHGIVTVYDRRRAVLVFNWICESCGERLNEASREPYVPAFNPRGNDSGRLELADGAARDLAHASLVRQQVEMT